MSMTTATTTTATTTVALKEWGAVVHALIDGRQTVLLRKGGIREKRFDVSSDRFVLFPTVAHAHAERVRPGQDDVLAAGAADIVDDQFVVRAGVELVDVIPTDNADGLAAFDDLHIWTREHIAERLAFRPKHELQVLVVRAFALPQPVTLTRLPEYGGCSSWVDLPLNWQGEGTATHSPAHLRSVADRIRAACH